MSRVLAIPFFLLSLLAWNRVRGFLALGSHTDFRPLFRQDPIFAFAHWLDACNVTEMQFVTDTLIAGLFLGALGFLFDAMLRGRGFGASGNAWLLSVGAALAAWIWSVWAPIAYAGRVPAAVLAAALGGGALLVICALIRHSLHLTLDEFGSGATAHALPRKVRPRAPQDVIRRQVRTREFRKV